MPKAVALIACIALAACAGPRPKFQTGGPKVAAQAQYKSANLRPYTIRGKTYKPYIPGRGDSQTGTATWYGSESGNMTANGERFIPDAISAAHKTWPLPSIVDVTNLDNGKTIRLRLNDRGPFVDGRLIDLSKGAAKALGVYEVGVARVRVTFVGPAETGARPVVVATARDEDNEQYRVQIGAFAEKENAERVREAVSGRIDEARGLYIVYLGPFKGAQAAELERQKVLSVGYFEAILTREK